MGEGGNLNSQKTNSWGSPEVGKDLVSGSFSVCLTAELLDLVCCSCEITLVPGLGDCSVPLRKGEVKAELPGRICDLTILGIKVKAPSFGAVPIQQLVTPWDLVQVWSWKALQQYR